MFKANGKVTGLYREDYNLNQTAAVFAKYSDVLREVRSLGAGENTDSYPQRIRIQRKGVA